MGGKEMSRDVGRRVDGAVGGCLCFRVMSSFSFKGVRLPAEREEGGGRGDGESREKVNSRSVRGRTVEG